MTTEQIEKLIKIGERKKFHAIQLAKYLTQPPFELTPVDATIVMDAYKRKHPSTGPFFEPPEPVKSGPVAQVAAVLAKKTRKKHEHTPSALVRSATKEFALLVSEKKRNGKFRRAGKSFIKGVEADLENIIRDIGVRNANSNDDLPGDWDFVNHLRIWPKLAEQLNRAIRRRIFERVMSQPSLGKTLK